MSTQLTVTGDVLNAYASIWHDPVAKQDKTTRMVQFLRTDAKGRAVVLNVRLPDTADLAAYPKGKRLTLPVDITAVDSVVYFRLVADTEAARPAASASAKTGTG